MRLKPGKYYLGDPCYVVDDEDHLEEIKTNEFEEFDSACVKVKENKCYTDSTGRSIDVDSNAICCLSVEYLEKYNPEALELEKNNIISFSHWFEVEKLTDMITIDSIEIPLEFEDDDVAEAYEEYEQEN